MQKGKGSGFGTFFESQECRYELLGGRGEGRGPSYVESLTSDSHPIKDDRRWTRSELMNPRCRGCKTLSPLSLTVRRNENGVYTADEACYVSPANLDTIAAHIRDR